MKKKFIFLFLGMTMGWMCVHAQVRIGSTDDPHSAALLDLRSSDRGLLLPVVSLTDYKTFLPTAQPSEWKTAKGMLVYNDGQTTPFRLPEGLYIWNGSKWFALKTVQPDKGIDLIDDPNDDPESIVLGSKD